MEQHATYVGLDVAKAQVDVAVRPTDDRWQVSRDEAGIRKLARRDMPSRRSPPGEGPAATGLD